MEDEDTFTEISENDLEYSEDSPSESEVNLENQYYAAKSLKEEDAKASLTAFQNVLELQGDAKGIWGFKALKQMLKIHFKLKNYQETMNYYKELLTYTSSVITKNHAEKSINSILDFTYTATDDLDVLKNFYGATLAALNLSQNDRLWFKTNSKLAKIYLEKREYAKLVPVLKQLKRVCEERSNFGKDAYKDTQLIEVYALEMQMHTERKNHPKLKELYKKSLSIRSAVPHPLIMSIIRECGGKMYLRGGDYERAYSEFFEAFKNYDESGSPRRLACLQYILLTSMLMKSTIDPFDSQEAKPYKNKPEIETMMDLRAAYQNNEMHKFEQIYEENKETILSDPFVQECMSDILLDIRRKMLLQLVVPYSKIKLSFISQELGIDEGETEDLVTACILDKQIAGQFDQNNHVLVMNRNSDTDEIYTPMQLLVEQISDELRFICL